MSKRAEELANQLYPDPKLEDYDDILVYRTDRNNALMGRSNVICVYEQAEKDLALTWEDIRTIFGLLDETARLLWFQNKKFNDKELCEETLRKFNESRRNRND